ncbi:hypothetical protein IW261DRAFT_1421615 [Armillaria novae-zelandiae]|uniref:Uncharacterized protein n=1 Tax=Armillaria novae-zelandiae TaxID=153914 RepID=A0AA39P2U3_9AGAR|nr:hypothetical protein IW261DRAFT_1421615 [Armillaria novae-zelandiae]
MKARGRGSASHPPRSSLRPRSNSIIEITSNDETKIVTDTLRPFNTMLCRQAAGTIESRASSRSQSRLNQFLAKVLLEAERRYGNLLVRENVDKLSIFSGWHTSLLNPRYHYTLRGYNKSGWMSVTIEMEAVNQGLVYTYQRQDWNQWMVNSGGLRAKHFFQPGDHVQGSRSQFCQLFNGEMVGGLHKRNPGCSMFLKTIANSRVDYCPGPFLCIVYRFLNYTPATFIGPLSYRWIVFWGDLSMASRSSVLQDTDINHFATHFSEYSCAANTMTVLTQKHSYHFQLAQRIPFASNTIDWEGRYVGRT